MTAHPRSWRELRGQLVALGGEPVRVRGSHEIWRFDDGEVFVVVRNHLGRDVPAGVVAKFRRLRAKRRDTAGQPAPRRATRSTVGRAGTSSGIALT